MEHKRDNKIIIVPVVVFFVFVFAIIGYKQLMGPEFSYPVAIYSTLFYFILNNISPQDAGNNGWLLIARYLAALILGIGIYNLLYSYFYRQYRILKIKLRYSDHVIVFSLKMVGTNFINDLLANDYKVILVEEESVNSSDIRKLEKEGVIVFLENDRETNFFDTLSLASAKACIVGFDDDNKNIELSLKLIQYLRDNGDEHLVRVLTHIGERNNVEVIKDYIDIDNAGEHFELDIFNIYSAAAKKIYDHYPPHNYLNFDNPAEENAIAVVGYNHAAEDFIIENIILSHYKDRKNIKIYLVDKEADNQLNHFMYKYPFYREFVDIVPLKLLNNKFFANFNWSKELIEKLSKVKAAYFFGDDGSELLNIAARFRQFISGQVSNYLQPPIIICFPEDTSIMSLLTIERGGAEKLGNIFNRQLNVHFVNMITDTCTSARLLEESEYIDTLARCINYFYSVKYEMGHKLKEKYDIANPDMLVKGVEKKLLQLSDRHATLSEKDLEHTVMQDLAEATKRSTRDLGFFTIKKTWDRLSYHKKSANRYAARHMAVKLDIMKHIGCLPMTHENILNSFAVIAPIEHKRWSAEKMMLNYRFGALPQEPMARHTAKEILKIHDQLISYEKLTDIEKEKDLNIFLLMPLLNSLKVEIKK